MSDIQARKALDLEAEIRVFQSGPDPPAGKISIKNFLKRILKDILSDSEWEVAIFVSVATLGTAWCVLQASIWSGIQTRNFAASAEASRESNLYQNKANQERLLDAQIYLSLADAYLSGNEKLVGFYLKRFPPGFRDSLPIWLSPSTPPRFRNLEAIQDSTTKELDAKAAGLRDQGEKMRASAGEANALSDTYVLVTVLFASTLFCSGLGGKMKTVRVRQYIFVFGAVFVIAAVILLMFLPVAFHWKEVPLP